MLILLPMSPLSATMSLKLAPFGMGDWRSEVVGVSVFVGDVFDELHVIGERATAWGKRTDRSSGTPSDSRSEGAGPW